jgi:hypothetical protein
MSAPAASLQMYQLGASSKDALFIPKANCPEAIGAGSACPVSPGLFADFNPIEQVFANLKALLRNADA